VATQTYNSIREVTPMGYLATHLKHPAPVDHHASSLVAITGPSGRRATTSTAWGGEPLSSTLLDSSSQQRRHRHAQRATSHDASRGKPLAMDLTQDQSRSSSI
jgi:hypothetical protein